MVYVGSSFLKNKRNRGTYFYVYKLQDYIGIKKKHWNRGQGFKIYKFKLYLLYIYVSLLNSKKWDHLQNEHNLS